MGYPYSAQPVLVSGANIKTIGGESVLGSGDIDAVSSADLQAALADYATLVYVGATFAPVVHTHAISDVTGLQTALDGKAALSHTHGNITNAGAIGSTANLPLITTTSGVITTGSFGTTANTFCQGNDSRLSDARTPTSHVHGNISNAGAIGSTSGLPIITGASGVLQVGAFGTTAGTFAQGNDTRIVNAAQSNAANTFTASQTVSLTGITGGITVTGSQFPSLTLTTSSTGGAVYNSTAGSGTGFFGTYSDTTLLFGIDRNLRTVVGSFVGNGLLLGSTSGDQRYHAVNHVFRNASNSAWGTVEAGTSIFNGNVGINVTPTSRLHIQTANVLIRLSEGALSQTPNLVLSSLSGKSVALMSGSTGSTLTFDSTGFFGIYHDSKTNIDSGSSGGGSELVRYDVSGNQRLVGNLQLGGASGARVRSSSGAVQARDSSDSAFANFAAALVFVGVYTVATLPSPSANDGASARVTDATSTTNGSVAAGGGLGKTTVFSNGTNWIIK